MRLLLRSVPHEHETVSGFILRIAEINHIYGYNLFRQLGATWTHFDRDPAEVQRAADTLGVPLEAWLETERNPTGYRLADRGELAAAENRFWGRYLGWFCPACLRERQMMKGEWQFPHLPVCIDHKIHLITACPSCSRSLDIHMRRKWLTRCRCGFIYSQAKGEPLREDEVQLGELIRRRFDPVTAAASLAAHPVSELKLGPLLRLVRFAGQKAPSSSIRVALEPRAAKEAFGIAAESMADWPTSFEKTLERLVGAPRSSTAAASKTYAGRFLSSHFKGSAGQPVRDVFRAWCSETRSIGSVSVIEGGTTSIQHLSGMLLCEPNVVRQMARVLSIPVLGPETDKSKAVRIENSAVLLLLEELQRRGQPLGYLRPYEARRTLGAPKLTSLVELTRDGLLRFKLHTNYAFFDEEDVLALLERLRPDRPVRSSDGPTQRLLYRNCRGGVVLSRLLEARATGDIPLLKAPSSPRGALSELLLMREHYYALRSPMTEGDEKGSVMGKAFIDVRTCVEWLTRLFPRQAEEAMPSVVWHSRHKGLTFDSDF